MTQRLLQKLFLLIWFVFGVQFQLCLAQQFLPSQSQKMAGHEAGLRPWRQFHNSTKGILFKNNRLRLSPRQSETAIITSKTYAQFDLRNNNSDFPQVYSMQILLNKYQVTPKSQPIQLRSRSVFYFHPCFRTNWHCLTNSVLELEYTAGLQLASNAKVEKIVEFKTDKRLFGLVGWIGKVGLKFHLHRLVANHKSQ